MKAGEALVRMDLKDKHREETPRSGLNLRHPQIFIAPLSLGWLGSLAPTE
jgi:hypothetical protein